MLQCLHIENVAVIEKADIVFGDGLTVLTGETGAGKSIVIDAINAALGERITRDVVREGADKAYISAVFGDLTPEVTAAMIELGFEPEEDCTLLIQRSLTADGKGGCRINGRPATVSALRQIGRRLVNIHGQHENQTLLDPDSHVEYLDRLGGLQTVREEYLTAYREYCRIQKAIKAATMDESEKLWRLEVLREQIAEIDAAAIRPGEEEELLSRREIARHAEKLRQTIEQVGSALDGSRQAEDDGALTRIGSAVAALQTAGQVSGKLAELAQRLQSVLYDAQACADEVRQIGGELESDGQELNALEDRLALIRRIVRKYGTDEASILAMREDLQTQLDGIESNDEQLRELNVQSDAARDATIAAAKRLTDARRKAARVFEQSVCAQLTKLDMPYVKLEVQMEPTALNAVGGERVEFLISSNPGEPAKSIARTASGGELSRIMLALKSVLSEVDDVATLVFDEVDSGISGRAATRVGAMLRQIAGCRQVLCVTHLAQIAANGHNHLQVSKTVENGRTFTAVSALGEEERWAELARIMGGEVTETTLGAAREMREKAGSST